MGILALVLGFLFWMRAKLTSLSRIAVEGMSHITRTYHYHNINPNTQIIFQVFLSIHTAPYHEVPVRTIHCMSRHISTNQLGTRRGARSDWT